MNAYLPSLARGSEEVVQALAELDTARPAVPSSEPAPANTERRPSSDDASSPLLVSSASTLLHGASDADVLQFKYNTALSAATARISALGIALGYAAGIALLLLALVPVTLLHGSTFALRLAIGLSGLWWALGSLPAAWWLPSLADARKDGDAAPGEDDARVWGTGGADADPADWSARREVGRAWRRLGAMLSPTEIKKLRNTFKYLAAWFLLSDGTPPRRRRRVRPGPR